jgi:uncharacterized protein YkwD
MAKQGQLAHTLDGKGPGERLDDVGYKNAGWGENCSGGQPSPDEAIKSWLSSEPHRNNIRNDEFTEVGLGMASDGMGGWYFTQLFAIPANN